MSNDNQIKAFEFAQEVTKQVITLSTGVLSLSVTFMKDIIPENEFTHGLKSLLAASWIVFSIAILFGILALMAMTGNLSKPSKDGPYSNNIRFFAGLQIITFFIGIVLTVIFASLAV